MNRVQKNLLFWLLAGWVGTMAIGSVAIADEADSPVTQSLRSTPWYDSEQNQVVPIPLRPRQDDSIHRNSRWLPKAKKVTKPKANNANATTGGQGTGSGGLFGSSWTLGNLFGWLTLAILILMTVGLVAYLISRAEVNLPQKSSNGDLGGAGGRLPDQQTLERIKHLPPELRRTDVNLRTECERLMNEQRFEQAIILLLGHQLLLLDQHGMLRLARGKTNGRYVRETRGHHEQCGGWLRQTADAFEQSYFGNHPIPADVFKQLWLQNAELELAAQQKGALI